MQAMVSIPWLELRRLAEVSGQVLGVAVGVNAPGRKQHHPLAIEQLGGAQILRALLAMI